MQFIITIPIPVEGYFGVKGSPLTFAMFPRGILPAGAFQL